MTIRNVQLDDALRICDIYNHYVENSRVTFETIPLKEHEFRARINDVLVAMLPFYVIELKGVVAGYCYLHQWNGRCAYTSTKEVSIYLDINHVGKGLGTVLYKHLFQNIDPYAHTLIAGISLPNEGSVRLHEKFGFKQVSCFKEIGWKFNQWQDVGHWQYINGIHPDKPTVL